MKRPHSSGRHRSRVCGNTDLIWSCCMYWLLRRVLQRKNCLFHFNVFRAQTQGLEGVLWYVYPQPDDRASSEVDDGVNSDHFQVQLNSTGPLHRASHHQCSTDWSRLLCTKQEKAGKIACYLLLPYYSLQAAKNKWFLLHCLKPLHFRGEIASFQHLAPFQCFVWTTTFYSL